MSSRRRHGGNFTDSLNSFRQTFHSHADNTCSTYKSFSQDSLDIASSNNRSITANSIILSGNFLSKASDASVLRDTSDLCENVDKQCYQMSKPTLELNMSDDPVKEDCNLLNTAICMSFGKHDMEKLVSLIPRKDTNPDHGPKVIDDKDHKENCDDNQVKDPGKPITYVGTPSATVAKPARNILSQMHIAKENNNIENQNDGAESNTGHNIDNVESRLILDLEQQAGNTNEHCEGGGSTDICNDVFKAKFIVADDIHNESSMSGNDNDDNIIQETDENLDRSQDCQFAEMLSHMMEELNPTQSIASPKQILKRLSTNFVASPKNFTERLITIIEESVTHSDSGNDSHSAVNLSRLTKEFRSMCKFIEDEPMPEWPPSPITQYPSNFEHTTESNNVSSNNKMKVEKNSELLKTVDPQVSSLTSTSHTPVSKSPIKLYKTPLNKLKPGNDNTNYMSFNVENDTFEVLEAQCKIMCSKEDENVQPGSVVLPQIVANNSSPNVSMKKYLLLCEQQMASLDVSDCDNARMQTSAEVQSPDKIVHCSSPKKMQTLQQQLMKKHFEQWNNSNPNSPKSAPKALLESPVIAGGTSCSTPLRSSQKNYKKDVSKMYKNTPSLHELEESVLLAIAEKRRRCFDTAVAMMKINSNGENAETQETVDMMSGINKYSRLDSLESNNKEFVNTLISCNKYFNYLEKHKTLINQVRSKEFSICEFDRGSSSPITSEKQSVENNKTDTKVCSGLKEPHRSQVITPKSTITPLNSPSKQNVHRNQKKSGRPKLFTTPGKSPVSRHQKRQPILFSNVSKASSLKKSPRINLKSPNTKGLYRFNYNTVLSPVGMYIKGTDVQLIQNVQSKTNNMLLTPEKPKDRTPRKNSAQRCQSKALSDSQEASLKFRLSPRSPMMSSQDINSRNYDINLSTHKGNHIFDNQLALPKVVYTLPAQVRTETKQGTVKNRVKGLLAAVQNKVVIRHEERIGPAEKKKRAGMDEMHEILYGSTDESVQVENIAVKTNFISKKQLLT